MTKTETETASEILIYYKIQFFMFSLQFQLRYSTACCCGKGERNGMVKSRALKLLC